MQKKMKTTLLLCAVVVGFGVIGAPQAQAGGWTHQTTLPTAESPAQMAFIMGNTSNWSPAQDWESCSVTGTYVPNDPNDIPAANITVSALVKFTLGESSATVTGWGGSAITIQEAYADLATDTGFASAWPYQSAYADDQGNDQVPAYSDTLELMVAGTGGATVSASVILNSKSEASAFGDYPQSAARADSGNTKSELLGVYFTAAP